MKNGTYRPPTKGAYRPSTTKGTYRLPIPKLTYRPPTKRTKQRGGRRSKKRYKIKK